MPNNKLYRLNPVTSATSTPEAGDGSAQKVSMAVAGLSDGAGIAIDRSQNIYITDYTKHVVYRYRKGDSVSKIFAGAYGTSGYADGQAGAARFNKPCGIACDKSGNVYIVDSGNALIRRIDQNANVYTVASIRAEVVSDQPSTIAIDDSGTIFYIDNSA